MKRKFLVLGLSLTVGIGSIFATSTSSVFAEVKGNQQLEDQKKEIQSKKLNIDSEINSKQNEINQIKKEQDEVNKEIKRLDLAVAETSSQMREKEEQIDETKKEIEVLKEEIEVVKERIKKRDELLQDRMRTIQENGGVISYVDVLLGAQSFSDFVNRVSAVSSFVQADRDILIAHQEDKLLLEETEAELSVQLNLLEDKLAELEAMKKRLDSQIKEKNKIMSQLQKEEEEVHAHLHDLEDEATLLAAQERAIKQEIEAWNQRQLELEAERKRLQDLAKQQAAKQTQGSSNSGDSSESKVNTTAPTPAVTGGMFMVPTTGRLSSNYGSRWGSLHAGVDIANGAATVPVVAAADGTVFRSYYSSSYGNVVFITHNIDGQIYTTVYAHLESRSVGEGQRISKGAMVGYMGNTGQSYGKHLHFEIHKGPWNISKSNSVNPRNYINF